MCMVKAKARQHITDFFPSLSVTINSSQFLIRSLDILNICFQVPKEDLQTNEDYMLCMLNLGKANDAYQILGIPFFASNYVVFDRDRQEIGFFAKNEQNFRDSKLRAEYYSKNQQEVEKELLKVIDLRKPEGDTHKLELNFRHLTRVFELELDRNPLLAQHNTSIPSILFKDNPNDLQYLMYTLIGIDCILGSIIISYIWRKRYVFATGRYGDLLRV